MVEVSVTREDFNAIKTLVNLATGSQDTLLLVQDTGIADMAGNSLTAIASPTPLPVRNYTRDASSPELEAFDLDMNGVTLTLVFSETVNVSTINFTAITLVDSDLPFLLSYTLRTGAVGADNSPIVEVQVLREDEDELKRRDGLATLSNDTYLLVSSDTIQDMDGNPVLEIAVPIPVRRFVADVTAPRLVNFTLDLTADVLVLTFSETVNVSSLVISSLSLQSEEMFNESSTTYHVLSDSSLTSVDPDPVISIDLGRFDRDELRRISKLATETAFTFLVIPPGSLFDMVEIPVAPVSNDSARMVTRFMADTVQPFLEAFGLDLTRELLFLNFSETIDIDTFDASQLTLRSNEGGFAFTRNYTLTGGTLENTDHFPYLTLNLSTPDLNAIKFYTDLAVNLSTTCLSFSAALLRDVAGNPIVETLDAPVQAVEFVPDRVPPKLLSFDLDMDEEVLVLTFDETVDSDSLDVTQLSLQPVANASESLYTLSALSFTESTDGTVIIVNVSTSDLNRLKQLDDLAVDNATTFLTITRAAIRDTNSNTVTAIAPSAALPVSLFTPDRTEPQLRFFSLDLDNETLSFSFSETVDVASSFDVTGIALQSGRVFRAGITSVVRLSGYANMTSTNGPEVVVQLLQDDLNRIKFLVDLGTERNDTYVTLQSTTVRDTFGNPLAVVEADSAHQAEAVFDDVTPPTLRAFDLDMDTGTVTFYFSESVNASSLDATQVTFHQFQSVVPTQTQARYTLTGSDDVLDASSATTVLTLRMSTRDTDAIKSLVTLATGDGNTFVAITSDFVSDQSGNPVAPNPLSSPARLGVANFTADTGCPRLDAFDLDLDAAALLLTFDEPVNTSTFDPTQLRLLSVTGASSYNLTSGSFTSGLYVSVLNFTLSDFDFDLISFDVDLATDANDTFVLLSERSLQDTAGISYCNDTAPTPVSTLVPDQTRPVLLNFSLDLLEETLVLTFSESVRLPLTPSALTLLAEADLSPELTSGSGGLGSGDSSTDVGNFTSSGGRGSNTDDNFGGVAQHTLSGGNFSVDYAVAPDVVTIDLTQDDLNAIKNQPVLATSEANTFISIAPALTSDHSSNPVVPIPRSAPLAAAEFVSDNRPPELVDFSLDMEGRVLTLTFSEVVNVSSFDVTSLTLQSAPQRTDGASSYTLQGSSSVSRREASTLTEVAVILSNSDSNAIKAIPNLATLSGNTFVAATSSLVRDFFGLPLVPIPRNDARPVALYLPDVSPPSLLSFSLNLTAEQLVLTFDETVDISSLVVPSIEIRSDEAGTRSVRLTNGSVSSSTNAPTIVVVVALREIDVYRIKVDLELATGDNDTCVHLGQGAISDLASSPPNTFVAAASCEVTFFPDTIPPALVSFVVNLNASTLTLNFDEPIDLDSIDETQLTLQGRRVAGTGVQEVTLTGGTSTSTDLLEVVLVITLADTNLVKQNPALLVDLSSSFLRLEPDFVVDLSGNNVRRIAASNALQASALAADVTSPVLRSFDVDMNTGELTLYFSETVNIRTLDFSGITLQATSRPIDGTTHTLRTGTVTIGSNAPTVTIRLLNDDLNELKTRAIARSNETAYIVLANSTIFDVSGRPVEPVLAGVNAIPVSGYTPDTTPPSFAGFSLDLTAETLTLSFNESVDALTLNVTHLTLATAPNITGQESLAYALETSLTTQGSNLPALVVTLSSSDLNQLKRRADLASSRDTTHLFLGREAVQDTFGNPVVQVAPSDAALVSSYRRDATQPVLEAFDFDANRGALTLTFSETVNTSSLDTSGVTLYQDSGRRLQRHTLGGGYLSVTPPSDVVTLVLTVDDLNQIKSMETLAVDDATLHLQLAAAAVSDMETNLQSNPVRQSEVLPVGGFVPDMTPPRLLNFTIDMNRGEVTLIFDETVNATSLVFDFLALISNETFMPIPLDPDTQHQLQDGLILTPNLPVLTFRFTEDDLNEVKRQDMCTRARGVLDCFLVYRTNAIQDMSGNGIDGCRQVNT